MNNTLFTMHDIKYIISVDDCYFAPRREECESSLCTEMYTSIDPFRDKLNDFGKSDRIDEYDELAGLGTELDGLIRDLVHSLTDAELMDLLSVIDASSYQNEKDGILEFLSGLKDQGCIKRYYTCGSTAEAMQLYCDKKDMADGNILWLLDRNFERVGESSNAGIQLAQNIVQRHTDQTNYVYILSSVEKDSDKNENDIELEFDEVLSGLCASDTASLVYYISKQRILTKDENKIEKSLAQGFKRKVCYELFQIYEKCLYESVDKSAKTISSIKQRTLNYLFGQKAAKEGESRFDLLTRLVQIFQVEEYNCALGSKHDEISDRLYYYNTLCEKVKDGVGDIKELTPVLIKLREIELYNKHINIQRSELSAGDIFRIEGKYFLLVSQSCDTYLRTGGERKLSSACLLEIVDQTQKSNYKRELSCFLDFKKPIVAYQSQMVIPFDVLDLCVADCNGHARIEISTLQEERELDGKSYTRNYVERYKIIVKHLRKVYEARNTLERYIDKDENTSSELAKTAFEGLLNEDAFIKKYSINEGVICYQIQRICRLDELTTVDVIKDYGATLSRIGQPFDFSTT